MDVETWQRLNPDKPFHQYYVEVVSGEIAAGKAHGTCGAKLKRSKVFGKVGGRVLKLLKAEGMEPHHTCVDYGCGSLRVGVHILNYLEPGRFWGLDVTDHFFEQGIAMLGPEVIERKRPNLRVLSPTSLREVAAGPRTTTLVKVRVAEREVQYKRFSWAYPKESFTSVIREAGGEVEFVPSGSAVDEDLGLTLEKYWLRISRRGAA